MSSKLWMCVVMFSIKIPASASLKDRRQVVRSLLDRLKKRYNASTVDLGPDGVWDSAELSAVFAGSSFSEVDSRADKICESIHIMEDDGSFEPDHVSKEVFCYDDI